MMQPPSVSRRDELPGVDAGAVWGEDRRWTAVRELVRHRESLPHQGEVPGAVRGSD